MRKTFLKVCVAALSLLAVSSCGKIWDEFDNVHGELDNLAARITALEEKLNSEVATINSKIGAVEAAYKAADDKLAAADADLLAALKAGDKELADALAALNEELDALDGVVDGYIKSNDEALKKAIEDYKAAIAKAVEDYKAADVLLSKADTDLLAALAALGVSKVETNEAGNVVITFADGSKIEVPANPETGVVTVVDGEWAVVVDGKVTMLGVPVHPDTTLDFMVDEKTNELLVSYDDKKTWEKTGVIINDETTINVIESFEYAEGDKYVTVTVGGVEYKLPIYNADNSSLVLGRADVFVMYGASKDVQLKAEGMAEYVVMSKPDGWKATVEGTTLTITAASKEVAKFGAAELEGEVILHGTTKEGKCKVAKIDVKTGDGLTLEVDAKGNIVIKNAYVGMSGSEEFGYTFGFQDFRIGIYPKAEFLALAEDEDFVEMFSSADPYVIFEEVYKMWGEPYGPSCYYYNNAEAGEYEEIKYEVDVLKTTAQEVWYKDLAMYEDLPYGSYVIWVASENADGLVDGVRFVDYDNLLFELSVVETYFNDAKVKLAVAGADNYMIGFIPESEFMMSGGGVGPLSVDGASDYSDFNDYMLGNRGPWNLFVKYGAAYGMSPQFQMAMPAEYVSMYFPEEGVLLSQLQYGQTLDFNERYYLWVMPMFNHMDKFDEMLYEYDYSAYDYDKNFLPYLIDFKTKNIEAGSECEPVIEFTECSWTSFDISVEAEGASLVYSALFSHEEYTEFETDEDIVAAVIAACEWPEEGSFSTTLERDVNYDELVSGAKYDFVVVAVDAEGKYTMVVEDAETKAMPTVVNDTYSVTFGTVVQEYESVSVNVTPSEVGKTYYYFYDKDYYPAEDVAEVIADVLVEGTELLSAEDVKKSYSSPEKKYVLAVLVVGEDGTDYKLFTKECATLSYPYDEENIELELASLSLIGENQYTAVFKVEGATSVVYQVGTAGQQYSMPLNVLRYAPAKNTNYGSYAYADVVDGKVTITFESSTYWMDYSSDLYLVAYNVENDAVSSMTKVLTFAVAEKYAELNSAE